MAVTDREYLEMMVLNVQKSNEDTVSFLKETISEMKKVQKTTCERVSDLENSDSAQKARNGFISGVASFLGFIVLSIIQIFRS